VVAVTPVIGGRAAKGPAAKMLKELGLDISGAAVARRYLGIIDAFVIDAVDTLSEVIPGIEVFTSPTLMSTVEHLVQLANEGLRIADTLVA
jgi:LPPG:FO 2-phospho-L-lactate transferase